jgi:hypothetical protein
MHYNYDILKHSGVHTEACHTSDIHELAFRLASLFVCVLSNKTFVLLLWIVPVWEIDIQMSQAVC